MRTASACLVALALVCVGATSAIAQDSDEALPATAPTALARGAGGFENTGLESPIP